MTMMRVEFFLIDGEEATDKLLEKLCLSYGGYTVVGAAGAWRGNNMHIVIDEVAVATVFAEDNERNRNELHLWMRQYRRHAQQESVLYVINGNNPIFVTE